jgi:hypothetical protein
MSRVGTPPVIGVIGVIGGRAVIGSMPASDMQVALYAIADRLRFLSPSHRDPERFHLDKAELVDELRRLARRRAVA